jgi:hypothetical protein
MKNEDKEMEKGKYDTMENIKRNLKSTLKKILRCLINETSETVLKIILLLKNRKNKPK